PNDPAAQREAAVAKAAYQHELDLAKAKNDQRQGPALQNDALDAMAEYYNQTGQMPQGTSRNVQLQKQIANRAAELRGGKPADLAGVNASNKADQAALAQLEKQRAVILAFEETAKRNADVALKLSDKVDRTGVPVLNQWILAGRKSVGGSGDVAAFNAAVETFTNEYAKLMSSATGSGVTSDEARRHAREMLNSAMTKEQFRQTLDVL